MVTLSPLPKPSHFHRPFANLNDLSAIPAEVDARQAKRENLKAWRAANPDKVREQLRRYRDSHREQIKAANERSRARLGPEYWREKNQANKRELIAAYGGKCACCGETEIAFLTIDHINGGGRQERLSLGNSGVLKKIRDAGFPNDLYRCLCMNCQFGFMHGRICPHQAKAA